MSYPKKAVIAINFNTNYNELYLPLKQMEFLKSSELHFVYVFPTISYGFMLEQGNFTYPVADERHEIERQAIDKIQKFVKEIFGEHKGKFVAKCLFGENPKETFNHYVDEIRADMVVVATRRKKGVFESSFAHFLSKHSKAHLLILRPHD